MKYLVALSCLLLAGCYSGEKRPEGTIAFLGQSNTDNLFKSGMVQEEFQNRGMNFNYVNCAVGGTPIKRWVPGGDLFESCMDKLNGRTVEAVFFLQGEAEGEAANQPAGPQRDADITAAAHWSDSFKEVVRGLHSRLNESGMPVYFDILKLDETSSNALSWTMVRAQQESIRISHTFPVSIDGIDYDPANPPHFTQHGYGQIAARFIAAYNQSR